MISSLTSGHPMWICSLGGNSEDEFGASAECSDPTFSDAPADSEDLLSLQDEAEPEFNVSFNNPASLGPDSPDSPDFWSADSEEELQLLQYWRPSLPETEKRIWNFDLAESREEEVEATPPPPADSQLPTHTRKRKSPSEEEPLPKIVSDASTKSSISSIPHHPTNPDSLRGAIDNNWSPLEQTQQPLPQSTFPPPPTNIGGKTKFSKEMIDHVVAQLVDEKIKTGKKLEPGRADEAVDLLAQKGIKTTRKCLITRVYNQYRKCLKDPGKYIPIISEFEAPLSSLLPPGCPQRS